MRQDDLHRADAGDDGIGRETRRGLFRSTRTSHGGVPEDGEGKVPDRGYIAMKKRRHDTVTTNGTGRAGETDQRLSPLFSFSSRQMQSATSIAASTPGATVRKYV